MTRDDRGEPLIAHECGIAGLNRRCDVVAVATAVMVRIAFVAIGWHLIGVSRHMTWSHFVNACHT
ncbi:MULTISPECIES: hypothetical protein [unclassified Novosphingobium]|uniref:hypothetical protein n=1 Tax=unclassified Novosphingobium TaxID=2644732 RepID=UPI001DE19E8B|nr:MULTISPECIES: hypothetical protein [unclassified Novosphingobium]MBX9663792.1 hypothetical protein [Novosphingobium sp.]HQS95412.1 hypothetical protein [Novosphingobium sp.]